LAQEAAVGAELNRVGRDVAGDAPGAGLAPAGQVPALHRLPAGGGQRLPVRGERQGVDGALMAGERGRPSTAGHVQEADLVTGGWATFGEPAEHRGPEGHRQPARGEGDGSHAVRALPQEAAGKRFLTSAGRPRTEPGPEAESTEATQDEERHA